MTEKHKAKREAIKGMIKKIASLSDEERKTLSDSLVAPCNPEGHQYSMVNTMLLCFQGAVNPTVVAGFNQWKSAGRTVRAGEHGFTIWFPFGSKTKDEDGNTETESTGGFGLTTVFDISQTEAL